MAKYIIFLDGELRGFLNDELSTKRAVSDLADKLIDNYKSNNSLNIRVFRENIDNGIKIYSQETGSFFNGLVNLIHNILWLTVPDYK
jgi:hypothetical protein